jgi:hypothetical protein
MKISNLKHEARNNSLFDVRDLRGEKKIPRSIDVLSDRRARDHTIVFMLTVGTLWSQNLWFMFRVLFSLSTSSSSLPVCFLVRISSRYANINKLKWATLVWCFSSFASYFLSLWCKSKQTLIHFDRLKDLFSSFLALHIIRVK